MSVGSRSSGPGNNPPLPSLVEIARDIRERRISAAEAVEESLRRIEAWQPRVNAFVRIDAETARAQARSIDEALAAGNDPGPLAGVPLAHKDMFTRAGGTVSGGSAILGELTGEETSTLLERLDAAGAVTMGGLNMAEFAAGPTGHNAHYGHARNPWNTAHITGGSSSGSGAAVASGQVYAALGSDTGGSIRLPAAICGLAGIKPTYGRVSRHGAMPRSWSLDTVGPLARSVEDCALVFSAIAGYDPRDPTSSRLPAASFGQLLGQPLRGLRLGVARGEPFGPLHPQIGAAHEASLAVFERLGARLVPFDMPEPGALFALADAVSKCEAAAMHGRWMRERRQDYSVHVYSRTEAGFMLPATRYIEALGLRGRVTRDFIRTAFAEVDVLHLPVLTQPVPTIAETDVDDPGAIPGMVGSLTRATRPFNYLGLPSLALPCGFSEGNLPVAMQLVGRPFSEPRLFSLGHAYQKETDWHLQHPSLPLE